MGVCRPLAIVMIMPVFTVGVVLMCVFMIVRMAMFMAVRVIVIVAMIMLSFYSAFTFTATAYCTHRAPL